MPDEDKPADPDHLAAYRAKRSADRSPEPVGAVSTAPPGNLFVVHKHAARQLHYDLRLEMDGVLRSWAVPRGPSYDQADKRLAVRVEDHPLEYGDFEGIIPEGNYGAGGVIVWDRGEWVPLEDWRTGLEKGKLLFEFRGYKLHGKWTLVKIKKSERDWLLIKERDGWMKSPGDVFPEESVLSGLTVEQVKAGESRESTLIADVAAIAPEAQVDPRKVQVMLADTRDEPFSDPAWVYELKLDGYRLLASRHGGDALLLTRNGNDYTRVFPEVARAIKALPFDSFIIDGEVVVMNTNGLPSFSKLQKRGRLTNDLEVRRAAVELPASYMAFDLLALGDSDVRSLPLVQRKEWLQRMMPAIGPVRYLDHIAEHGEAMLERVRDMHVEGIVAKKADSRYVAGRSSHWLKIKAESTGDFVVVGFTQPKRGRSGFGALQIADYVNGQLVYAGRVGTGFSDAQLNELLATLSGSSRETPPCLGPVKTPGSDPLPSEQIPETSTTTWVEPQLVCEVRFREWTPDGVLRHPAFLRLRDDKSPRDCERQGPGWQAIDSEPEAHTAPPPPAAVENAPVERRLTFSNLRKVFWPAEQYTKGDLIAYYKAIAPWLLPYLKNRPVVMTRYPDGIDGKSFYQKDAPEFAPAWIRTIPIWANDTSRFIRYFLCDDEDGLQYLANLGTIPLHVWASREGSLELPDWCVIDLDPKEAPFSDVVRTALVLHDICDRAKLPHYVKTTGKTGLHIMIPLGRTCTYEQSRTLGELLARLVIRELPDITTITRHVTKRGDKVYLDYLQNRHGQLIVAPFSVRPIPGAPVSMPITWDEVNDSLDPQMFTIRNAVERMTARESDPCAPVLTVKPDLAAVLERLTSA